jgi:hypothetical protein
MGTIRENLAAWRAARVVACPVCSVAPEEECIDRTPRYGEINTIPRAYPHPERVKAGKALAEEAR